MRFQSGDSWRCPPPLPWFLTSFVLSKVRGRSAINYLDNSGLKKRKEILREWQGRWNNNTCERTYVCCRNLQQQKKEKEKGKKGKVFKVMKGYNQTSHNIKSNNTQLIVRLPHLNWKLFINNNVFCLHFAFWSQNTMFTPRSKCGQPCVCHDRNEFFISGVR